MNGNLRTKTARDFVLMNRNNGEDVQIFDARTPSQPQRAHCAIETRTMHHSDGMWWAIRCSQECPDSWNCLSSENNYREEASCAEIRYGHYNMKETRHYNIDNEDSRSDASFANSTFIDHSIPLEINSDFNAKNVNNQNCISNRKIDKRRKSRSTGKCRIGRNARERKRVRAVSTAFLRLRKVIPQTVNNISVPTRRISKLKTLRGAIHYIKELQQLLNVVSHCRSISNVSNQRFLTF